MSENKILEYDIVLTAPVGNKKGTMSFEITDGKISGTLSVMKYDNPFSGTLDEHGKCRISGSIKTLVKTASYEGSGYIDDTDVTFVLNMGKLTLVMTGKPKAEKGATQ